MNRNYYDFLKMGSNLMVFRVVLICLLIESTTCESDRIDQDACQAFVSAKQVKELIEVKKKSTPPCPCLKQKIDLDYSFEKDGDCYRSWIFEDGVKQMCCYSSDGNLLVGAPHGGYLLFEDQWRNMAAIKRSCCLKDKTCQLFYDINPSDDCSSYKPPITVTSFGDPNIDTIDGNKFDFNGHGEYVFLKTSALEIQVRLGYVTSGNNDSTLFEAFAIFDNANNQTFEVHNNRSSQTLSVYRDGELFCNLTVKEHKKPCEMPPKNSHCMLLTDGKAVVIIGSSVREFANSIEFTPGELMDVIIMPSSGRKSINITGLAGHQEDGKFIFRNGTGVGTNSSRILFDYGESWSLVNASESHFNYSLTSGNFTFYNKPHSRPRFLEDLVGNLTALFKGYPGANISLINDTCRNDWDNRTNEECLLTIARTKQVSLGEAVMKTVNEEHRKWEILNNRQPYFLGNMTDNVTAVNGQDVDITIDLKQYSWDNEPDKLSFKVETKLPSEEFSLDKEGVFIWKVGTGLRYLDTGLTFFVIDRYNASAKHDVTVNYCGCEDPSECDFDVENSNSSGKVIKAGCQCPEFFSGLYCEISFDPCNDTYCYNNKCSMNFERSSPSWPCAPCPKGTKGEVIFKNQTCTDIDECVDGYSGKDKCEHDCANTDGSFNCSCRNGYTLNSNNYSCNDNDECTNDGNCKGKQHTFCHNTPGSYKCLCVSGYENSSGTCKKIEGPRYVGSMTIAITATKREAESLNKTIDTEENRDKFQKKLDKGFNGTKDYESVEVLSIMIISCDLKKSLQSKRVSKENVKITNLRYRVSASYYLAFSQGRRYDNAWSRGRAKDFGSEGLCSNRKSENRQRREAGKEHYYVRVHYVVTWAKNKTVDDTVSKELLQSFQENVKNEPLVIENVRIDIYTDNFDVKSGNESGLCSFPDQINCDLTSMTCIDGPGNYTCQCKKGFKTRGSKFFCADAIECKDSNSQQCSGHGKCSDTYGGFTCHCDKGFRLNDTDPRNPLCQDIDECESDKYTCYHGQCSNDEGGWNCTCNGTGFIRKQINTGFICQDIDECYNSSYICKDGICKNNVGDWSCTCESGYIKQNISRTNVTCEDIDECYQFSKNGTSEERCVHGICKNKPGSWDCNCPRNRTLQSVGNNSYAIYRCQGDYQYIGQLTLLFRKSSNVSNKSVETFVNKTITELFLEKNNVTIAPQKGQPSMRDIFLSVDFWNATFENIAWNIVKTSYVLHLGEAVTWEWVNDIQSKLFNRTTMFISEGVSVLNSTIFSEKGINLCNIPDKMKCNLTSTVCNVHNGSGSCDCRTGFSRIDDHRCKDTDECKQGQDVHICSNGGTCKNTYGNWTCSCPQGYTPLYINETFINCTDTDECKQEQDVHTCSNGGTCKNTYGNWTCSCPQGYTPLYINEAFTNCTDIDECKTPNISCIDADECKNTIGNWTCKCGEGLKENTINETSKVCAGEYQYVASVSFTISGNATRLDNKSLEVAITHHVLDIYKKAFEDSKVWVEILRINYPNSQRKRRSTSPEQISVEYIVHFDKIVDVNKLETDGFHLEKEKKLTVDNVTLIIKDDGIHTYSTSAICETKNNDCDNKTSTCKSTTGKIECSCKEGLKKDHVSSRSCIAARTESKDSAQTTVIAVGSSLSGLVVILSGVIFGVLRWKRQKIKEEDKIIKHNKSDLQDFNGSYLASQYITGSHSDIGSLPEQRFSNVAIPRVKQNADARCLYGHVPDNLYSFPQKPPKPHYKGSLPDLTIGDVVFYPSNNQRLSDQYPGRNFSHVKGDFSRSNEAVNDSGRFSPILDYRRQGSSKPDYDRFQEKRLPSQKYGYINGNDRPRSPKADYGRLNGNRRSRSPNPDYRLNERQERSDDSGVGQGYSSDSNDYRWREHRGMYPTGYRYSDTRF